MVKIDLGKCCMNCDHPGLRIRDIARGIRFREDGGMDFLTDAHVLCAHQGTCPDYYKEPIEAAPAEDILNG